MVKRIQYNRNIPTLAKEFKQSTRFQNLKIRLNEII